MNLGSLNILGSASFSYYPDCFLQCLWGKLIFDVKMGKCNVPVAGSTSGGWI